MLYQLQVCAVAVQSGDFRFHGKRRVDINHQIAAAGAEFFSVRLFNQSAAASSITASSFRQRILQPGDSGIVQNKRCLRVPCAGSSDHTAFQRVVNWRSATPLW